MSPADIAAVSKNNDSFGNGAWWLIVLFLFCFMGQGNAPMPNLAASQNAQTGQIIANNGVQTQELISRLATPTPVPAYIVANPYTGVTGGTADATKVSG